MNYRIIGEPLSAVICDVGPNETLITEGGAMSWMTPNMRMETSSNGGFGKMVGRALSGESLFLNRYTATDGAGQITFSSKFPGSIKAFEIAPGKELIVQKSGFLAGEASIELSVFFQKKLSAGLFGGEGFIMQKISGSGTVFIEIDGSACEYELASGQSMIVDTGYLAVMDATCRMEVQTVPGIKNKLFGGEGLFNTVVTGPGKIILQTMPITTVAGEMKKFISSSKQ